MYLVRLVNDLHTLSVADIQGMPCDFQPCDVVALLGKVVLRWQADASKRGLSLTLQGEPDMAALPVVWDAGRIEQVLNNLLANSLRYTDAPGTIDVRWQASPTTVTIAVSDSPPGVAASALQAIFEPLVRLDPARQRGQDQGSGLGLSIALAIMKAHGGSLSAKPSHLGGIALLATLPRHATGGGGIT
jgi:two-component system sensor histidine kinase BaeS